MNDVTTIYLWDQVRLLEEELPFTVTYQIDQFFITDTSGNNVFISPTVAGVFSYLRGRKDEAL
jgi:hypothetical protein